MAQHEVLSPVVGAIGYYHVEDGSTVEEKDLIMAVESMKTYFEVRAPASGVVRFKANLGETIAQNDVIAIVETEV